MLKIDAIETKEFTIIKPSVPFANYTVNTKKVYEIDRTGWYKVKGSVNTIEKILPKEIVKKYYELIDNCFESDKVPRLLNYSNVMVYSDYEDDFVWIEKYKHLKSLYELKIEYSNPTSMSVDFEYNLIMKNDQLKFGTSFDFEIYKSEWVSDGFKKTEVNVNNDYISDVKFQFLDKLLLPSIVVRDNCPVRIGSKKLYDIVRAYILQNADRSIVDISSDYAFCFTVKKRILRKTPIVEEIEVMKQNGRPYKNPRYKTKTYTHAGSYTIFEMTNSIDKYSGYTVIPELYANDLDELNQKLIKLLDELIKFINKPVNLCPHCEGTGVTDIDSKKINTVEFFK